jgi:hypothetical protein
MSKVADTRELIASARKFAAQFSGFMKIAEALEGIVSIDAAEEESQGRLAATQRKEADAKAQCERTLAELDAQCAKKVDAFNKLELSRVAEQAAVDAIKRERADEEKLLAETKQARAAEKAEHEAWLRRLGARA